MITDTKSVPTCFVISGTSTLNTLNVVDILYLPVYNTTGSTLDPNAGTIYISGNSILFYGSTGTMYSITGV